MKLRYGLVPAIFLGLGILAVQAKDKAAGASDLAKLRPVDEFNPAVTKKDGSESKPVQGGALRIRIPIAPKSLNRIVENGSQARLITSLMGAYLIDRHRETFEWLPYIARSWESRDALFLKPEKEGQDPIALEGLTISNDPKAKVIIFAVGAGTFTLGKHDLKSYDAAAGVAITKDHVVLKKNGRTYSGSLVKGKPDDSGKVALAVDMKWAKKETLTFDAKEVRVIASKTYRGKVREGITGNKASQTIRVSTASNDIRTIDKSKVAIDSIKIGKRKKQIPALRQQVIMYFHMRDGVRWHDGPDVTPDDIVFTLDTIRNSNVDCAPLRSYFIDVKSCKKVSRRTVRFEYSKQYFRALSFCGSLYIMPRHAFQVDKFKGDEESFGKHFNKHEFNRKPVGCGPYRFSRWDSQTRQIEVVRNEDYYGKTAGLPYLHPQQPYLDKITWIVINKKEASIKEINKGTIDVDFDIEPLTWRDPENQSAEFTKSMVRAKYLRPLYTYIGWNQNRPGVKEGRQFFRDKNVRRAMTMLIDRATILKEIHGGLGERVTGPFYRHGPFHSGRVSAVQYAPERAKVLLDNAGWVDHDGDGIRDKDGVKFEFDYLIHNARAYHQKIADKIKESVEQAGIRMNIRKIDWRSFQNTVSDRKFDAVRFAWGEPSCIETDPYQIWHSSQAANRGSNYVSFRNDKADGLIERVRRSLDFKERQKLLKRFHRLVAEEQPYTFLFNFFNLYFYNKRFRNVKFYVIGEDSYELTEWYIPKELQKKP
jgi:peptide/nickel transport system substrate-binding protein